jgi:predicted 3-demethylubiquinone-9 3-methyltransferase (glyoxalase superfamily)
MPITQKITPFLWFDTNAEEAVNFYTAIFKNSKILDVTRWGEGGPGPKGSVMTMSFELEGQQFTALNGGPHFKFTEAVSFYVNCETQKEVDELWEKLLAGGTAQQCGWLKDKFGLSWQIIPSALIRLTIKMLLIPARLPAKAETRYALLSVSHRGHGSIKPFPAFIKTGSDHASVGFFVFVT